MAHSLKVKIILIIFLTTSLSIAVFLVFQNVITAKLFKTPLQNEILAVVKLSVSSVDGYTHMMEQKASDLALAGEIFYSARKGTPSKNLDAEMEKYLTDNLTSFPAAIGGGLWYEPQKFYPDKKYYGPYVFWENGKVLFTWDLTTPEYDYFTQSWYTTALPLGWDRTKKRERTHYWTAPYYDEAGSFMLMSTVDAFMYDEQRVIIGLSTADWSIEDMLTFLRNSRPTPDSGILLVDTNANIILTNTLATTSTMKSVETVSWMSAFVEPEKGNVKITSTNIDGITYDAYYVLTEAGMLYGMLVPSRVLLDAVSQLTTSNIIGFLTFNLFLIAVLYFALLKVTNPIIKLTNIVTRIGAGDFAVKMNVESQDEIGQLGMGVNKMVETLSFQKEEIDKREALLVSNIKELESFKSLLEDKVIEKTAALTLQIQETQSRSEELQKFQLAVEHTSQHVIITDVEGKILYANAAVVLTTGYSREEVLGKKPSLWGGLMSKEFFADLWRTIKVEKNSFSGEIQNRRKNGEMYTATTIISPIVDMNGAVKFFVGLETDISKQKALERVLVNEKERIEGVVVERTRDLQNEHARLLAAINSLSFGFIIADMDDRVILQNSAMSELFELSGGPITISNIAQLVGAHFDLKMQIERCFTDKSACVVNEVIFGKKFLRGTIAPVVSGAVGEKIGYVLLFEDITEAHVLDRGRDEFFAIASHELRTPLTAIRGNMSLIEDYYQDKITDKEVLEMVHDTNSAASRLITIVNDFLDVSRLEQGRVTFQVSDFSAHELVDEVIKNITEVAAIKGMSVKREKIDGDCLVRADRDRSLQVLTNIISNAVNYSEHGTVTVGVAQDDEFVEFDVSDEGVGINTLNQSLLFRKFQQAGESVLSRDVTQSTGLGLYISRLVIEPMGGKIWLKRSVAGEGSTFAFTLPLARKKIG